MMSTSYTVVPSYLSEYKCAQLSALLELLFVRDHILRFSSPSFLSTSEINFIFHDLCTWSAMACCTFSLTVSFSVCICVFVLFLLAASPVFIFSPYICTLMCEINNNNNDNNIGPQNTVWFLKTLRKNSLWNGVT